MDLGQIEAFIQVTAHRSFSRAAGALQLTQPSVTARIQSLERELGEELFERSGRGVSLTDAGKALLPHATKIVRTLRESLDAVAEVRSVQIGTLRLGSAITISTYVLPKILNAFRDQSPRVDVSIRTGRSEQVLAMLLADEVQVGLVRSLNHPEIETIPLYEDEIVLISHPTHRFAATGRASIDEVALEPIILFDRGSSYYGLINGFLRQAGVIPNVAMELDSLEATKRMVEEGLAIALIPRVTIERELAIGVLAKVDIVDAPPPRRPISIILHKNRKRSRTAQAFMDTVCRMYQVSLPAV